MVVVVSEFEFIVVFNFIVLIVLILKKIICRLMEKMKCKLNFEIVWFLCVCNERLIKICNFIMFVFFIDCEGFGLFKGEIWSYL